MPKIKSLYDSFQPSVYKLKLTVDDESKCYRGNLTLIGRKVGKPSHRITLHQKNLKISKAEIEHQTKKAVVEAMSVSRVNLLNGFEEVRIHTKNVLYPGNYTLDLSFSTSIASSATDNLKLLLEAKIKAGEARSWLPCIDEASAWSNAKYQLDL